MSRKRRNTSSPELDDSPPPKRRLSSSPSEYQTHDHASKERPQINQSFGQVNAIPGLGTDDGELFYGPATDGIDYLRMVRSEAKDVTLVLAAPVVANLSVKEPNGVSVEEPTEDVKDGIYSFDGTYTSRARIADTPTAVGFSIAQSHYYDSLLAQFLLHQATLRCSPPMTALDALDKRPITFPAGSKEARELWEDIILAQDPHPVQIASMDAATVLELVRFLSRKLLHLLQSTSAAMQSRVGAWVWSILGKCPELGAMDSDEVSEMRELARKAGSGLLIKKGSTASEGSILEEAECTGSRQETEGVADSYRGKSDRSGETEAAEFVAKTMVLDMIVTVVGEVYGQRDLLETRPIWTSA